MGSASLLLTESREAPEATARPASAFSEVFGYYPSQENETRILEYLWGSGRQGT
jgi:hypothetical protein